MTLLVPNFDDVLVVWETRTPLGLKTCPLFTLN